MDDVTLADRLRADLRRQAGAVAVPPANPADARRRARAGRSRRVAAVAAVVVAGGAAVIGLTVSRRVSTTPPATLPPSTPSPPPTTAGSSIPAARYAVLLTPTDPETSSGHRTIVRVDRSAAADGWSLIVRAADGDFAYHSAVITYPARAARPVTSRLMTWPVAGATAEIVGDLPADTLVALMQATRVVDGRPRLDVPPGLTVVYDGPRRGERTSEARYGAVEFGAAPTLGDGLVFADVVDGAEIEATVLGAPAQRQGLTVHGTRAVEYPGVGNGAVAWQLAPGRTAFVGWSGNALGDEQIAAIVRIAETGRVVSVDEWQATDPQEVDNTPSPASAP